MDNETEAQKCVRAWVNMSPRLSRLRDERIEKERQSMNENQQATQGQGVGGSEPTIPVRIERNALNKEFSRGYVEGVLSGDARYVWGLLREGALEHWIKDRREFYRGTPGESATAANDAETHKRFQDLKTERGLKLDKERAGVQAAPLPEVPQLTLQTRVETLESARRNLESMYGGVSRCVAECGTELAELKVTLQGVERIASQAWRMGQENASVLRRSVAHRLARWLTGDAI